MKNASENQEVNGMLSGNFSPGDKVQGFYPLHPKHSITLETPIKSSQHQNRYPLLPQPPRRFLPFNSPELHHQQPLQPPQHPGRHCNSYHPSHASVKRLDEENHHCDQPLRSQMSNRVVYRRPWSSLWLNSHSNLQDKTAQNIIAQKEKDTSVVSSSEKRNHLEQDSHKGNINQPCRQMLSEGTSHTNRAHHLVQKRRREGDTNDANTKKQCLIPPGPDGTLHFSIAKHSSPVYSSQTNLCQPEQSLKISNNHLLAESAHLKVAPALSTSHPLKSCLKHVSLGAKQACIQSIDNSLVVLQSPHKKSEVLTNSKEVSKNECKRVSFCIPNVPNDSKSPGRIPDQNYKKTADSVSQKTNLKQSKSPSSSRKLQPNKKPIIADDIHELFMPDPTTHILPSRHKIAKVGADQTKGSAASSSSNPQTPAPELCQEHKTSYPITRVPNVKLNLQDHIKISLPTIILTRIPLDIINTSTRSVGKQEVFEKSSANSQRMSVSTFHSDEKIEDKAHKDSLDLGLELDFDMNLEVASISSSSSEEEQLESLQEIMTRKNNKAEKRAFSETKHQHSTTSSPNTGNYQNNLEQILKDLVVSRKAKDAETELLAVCQEDMLRLAEHEEALSREVPISAEQQIFLQRYSLSSNAIREIPPGHEVFNLETFGRLFNQDTLQLRHCSITPQNVEQKTLLWSSHVYLKSYINCGLVQKAYEHMPCPFRVTCFLFKMLSVHSDGLLSNKILEVLKDLALQAAVQRVNKGEGSFKVWLPSLADMTLVLMNMGAPFGTLFPLDSIRPPFTEADLLEDVIIKSDCHPNQESRRFFEHNLTNVYKYLNHCMALCPRFYSDKELLLLLTLVCTASLDTRLLLRSRNTLYPVISRILKNIRSWEVMMPKMCQCLTALSDDHHNLCHLVQLLPHHSRGIQLRQHLSLSMISKLLDGRCLYVPRSKELQLSDLRPYVPRLKPSRLQPIVMAASHQSHREGEEEEDTATADQEAYYLCYSLLTLVNESTNFQFYPAHQKEQLLLMCSELDRHVKSHIREGERWIYRSKVKDLVARIYTKWQMILQKTRPLNGQLYDWWQPLQDDVGCSQDIEEIESSQTSTEKVMNENSDAEADMAAEEEEKVLEIHLMQNKGEETSTLENCSSNADAEETKSQEEE